MGCDWYSQMFYVVTYVTPDNEVKKVFRGMNEDREYVHSYRSKMPAYDSDDEDPPLNCDEVLENLILEYKRKNPNKMLYDENEGWLIRRKERIEAIKYLINTNKYELYYSSNYISEVGTSNDHIDMEDVISIERVSGGRIRY